MHPALAAGCSTRSSNAEPARHARVRGIHLQARQSRSDRCPAPASVKATVNEPLVTKSTVSRVRQRRGRGTTEDGAEEARITEALAAAETELESALDGRLPDALGASLGGVPASVERRNATVESPARGSGAVQSGNVRPLPVPALEDPGTHRVEQRRRVLHSVYSLGYSAGAPRTRRKRQVSDRGSEPARFLSATGRRVPTTGSARNNQNAVLQRRGA